MLKTNHPSAPLLQNSTHTIEMFCKILKCNVEDIMQYIEDKERYKAVNSTAFIFGLNFLDYAWLHFLKPTLAVPESCNPHEAWATFDRSAFPPLASSHTVSARAETTSFATLSRKDKVVHHNIESSGYPIKAKKKNHPVGWFSFWVV